MGCGYQQTITHSYDGATMRFCDLRCDQSIEVGVKPLSRTNFVLAEQPGVANNDGVEDRRGEETERCRMAQATAPLLDSPWQKGDGETLRDRSFVLIAGARIAAMGAQSASTTLRSSPQLAAPAVDRGVAQQISTSSSAWGALGSSR